MSPYGEYGTVIDTLCEQLAEGPYLLGEKFSAADVLWGTALWWTVGFKVVPERPQIMSYRARLNDRAAFKSARQKDAAYAKTLASG